MRRRRSFKTYGWKCPKCGKGLILNLAIVRHVNRGCKATKRGGAQ